jgi:hypothetical protein
MAYLDSAPATEPGPDKPKDAKNPTHGCANTGGKSKPTANPRGTGTSSPTRSSSSTSTSIAPLASARRFALLWSNIETLKPSIYAKLPVVMCSRRYKDSHPVGRVAADLLERATNARRSTSAERMKCSAWCGMTGC